MLKSMKKCNMVQSIKGRGHIQSSENCNFSGGNSELSTGRMDPRVGSGRVTILPDFRGSDRFSTLDFLFFTDYFLVPESI